MRAQKLPVGILVGLVALVGLGVASPSKAQSAADQFVGKWTIAFEAPSADGSAGAPGGGRGAMGGRGGGGAMGGRGGGGGIGGGMGRGGPTVLEISQDGDKLVASLSGRMGAMGEPIAISDVRETDGVLVLTYSLNMQGQAAPVTMRLTRDGTTLKVAQDVAGRFQRHGTATKE